MMTNRDAETRFNRAQSLLDGLRSTWARGDLDGMAAPHKAP
jgi:hypothetical protein